MRRSLAGLLLLISCVMFAVSISTWWLQQVAFSPSADTDITYSILGDDDIRGEVATLIATADAGELGTSTAQLKEFIEQISRLDAGAALMSGFVSDAHARLIGDSDEPVRISAEEQYTIVRDERAALSPDITLPVPEVSSLALINTTTWWLMLLTAAGGLLMLVVGFVTRPERGEFTFAIAVGMGVLAVLLVLFGYLVPIGPLTALSDTTWMGVFPQLANRSRNTTLFVALVCAVIAAAVLLGTSGLRQRRQRSTPLSVGRYREQHSWSR
ncbi:MAG: hypothetical protein HKN44_05975 [Ilumatobacter sp.]|nr:hypothetical protein [Ilumatobacter sp.]